MGTFQKFCSGNNHRGSETIESYKQDWSFMLRHEKYKASDRSASLQRLLDTAK